METERAQITIRKPEAKPTGKQVYALAHELCVRMGIDFQRLRDEQARGAEM